MKSDVYLENTPYNPVVAGVAVIFQIVILIYVSQTEFSILRFFILSAILQVFMYIFGAAYVHQFGLKGRELIVKNLWMPWIKHSYSLQEIESLEYSGRLYLGNCLSVSSRGKSRTFAVSGTTPEKIEEFCREVIEKKEASR